jgi:hypothetical protein
MRGAGAKGPPTISKMSALSGAPMQDVEEGVLSMKRNTSTSSNDNPLLHKLKALPDGWPPGGLVLTTGAQRAKQRLLEEGLVASGGEIISPLQSDFYDRKSNCLKKNANGTHLSLSKSMQNIFDTRIYIRCITKVPGWIIKWNEKNANNILKKGCAMIWTAQTKDYKNPQTFFLHHNQLTDLVSDFFKGYKLASNKFSGITDAYSIAGVTPAGNKKETDACIVRVPRGVHQGGKKLPEPTSTPQEEKLPESISAPQAEKQQYPRNEEKTNTHHASRSTTRKVERSSRAGRGPEASRSTKVWPKLLNAATALVRTTMSMS